MIPGPRLCAVVFFVLCFLPVHRHAAAASGVSERLDALLEAIPAHQVESGILYDRVLPLSDIDAHRGEAGDAPASASEWRQMYHEIYRASLTAPSWPTLGEVMQRAREPRPDGATPILVMNFLYDRIRPDAIASGALVPQAGRLVPGRGEALLAKRVFAAVTASERTYRGGNAAFVVSRRDYYSNDGAAPSAIEIDFGDGRGFVPVPFDRAHTVQYATIGQKLIRMRLALAGGATLSAALPFEVVSLGTPPPSDTLSVTASIPYLGQTASGEAYVYLAANHTALTNPIVVIEGFDLDNSMNWDELYALLNREELLETLRAQGFDAVVLNFANAVDYVQRNAFVVLELITQVQAAIDPQMSIGLVGASMGGLASRYALAYAESAAIPHRVRTFVSFDSPHSGASIPLGLQYWLAFFADDSAEAAALLAALDAPAARQMLAYHHTEPPSTIGEADPLRAGLLADLAAAGDYPTMPRLVAVANGSGTQVGQGFAAGAQVVEWEYDSFFVDVIGNVWAVADAASQPVFHGLVHVIFTSPDEEIVSVGGTRPFDNAPGGSRASMAQMDATPAPFGDIIALHDSHCFIPTTSALAIASEDLFYDVAGDPDILSKTPFDAVYFPTVNQEHVAIGAQNASWLLAELQAGVTSIAGAPAAPDARALLAASPSPFVESTRIRFALPRAGHARLAIYDVSGRRVTVLLDERLEAGSHEAIWNGSGEAGRRLGSGAYIVALHGDGFGAAAKVLLR